jgi:hypothetical protein
LLTKEFSESFQILETHEMNTMFYWVYVFKETTGNF